jgi:tRNA dimethylallyltransferase
MRARLPRHFRFRCSLDVACGARTDSCSPTGSERARREFSCNNVPIQYRRSVETVFLVGPTAVGKTAVALELAQALDAEIVSADSMQVYRGMDIGTAKDSRALLTDVVEITEPFDVKRFVTLARAEIAKFESVIVCGGTGLYIRALRQGLFEGPGRDEKLRQRLEAVSAEKLFAELERLDPKTAKDIDRCNPRRLIRALEVVHATGKSIRQFQAESHKPALTDDGIFGLTRKRDDLYRRIERRIDEQIAAGWVEEVRWLMARGLEQNKTAMQAAGYRELVAHIRGELSLGGAVEMIKQRTRQLARRQLTWFRREPDLIWVEIGRDEPPAETARRVREILEKETARNVEDV